MDGDVWGQRLGVWWIARDHPDLPAVVCSPTGERLTYGELAGRAHQLARAFGELGLVVGDVVAFAFPNGVDTVVWQLAASEAGLRYIALNPSLSTSEIDGIVGHSEAKVLAIHADLAERLEISHRTAAVDHKIAVHGPIEGFVDLSTVVQGVPQTPPDQLALGGAIHYSSGTTGQPKAIWRPLPEMDPWELADKSKLFGRAFNFIPFGGAHLVSAGMHHGGCQGFYLGALNVGQPLAIMGKFDAEQALGLIEEHRVSTAYMVPTQFVRLLRLPDEVRARYDHSSIEVVVHAAAPCPLEVKKQMLEWWGPVIWETYGGTEAPATIAKPHRWLEKPGTVGRAIRGMRVTILGEDGVELPRGEVGAIYLESKGTPFEYKGDPALTKSVHIGRAFTLGDVGYLDPDGYLFICDRAKDLIISGGVNIYPAEVEGVLAAHPMVGDVAVIGVPDPEWGEQVKAIVELTAGVAPSDQLADDLQAWCRGRLAAFKCPRSVDFRAELPRTDGGKLAKRLLRDEFWQSTGRRV